MFVLVFYSSPWMEMLEMSDEVWAVLKATLVGSSISSDNRMLS